jgi:hypothetical protein
VYVRNGLVSNVLARVALTGGTVRSFPWGISTVGADLHDKAVSPGRDKGGTGCYLSCGIINVCCLLVVSNVIAGLHDEAVFLGKREARRGVLSLSGTINFVAGLLGRAVSSGREIQSRLQILIQLRLWPGLRKINSGVRDPV